MKRREAIKSVALLMGGALSLSTLAVFQSGCNPSEEKQSGVFTLDQKNLFDDIADIIIPETTSPGAREAQVGIVIAAILEDCYKPEDQNLVIKSLEEIDKRSSELFKAAFVKVSLTDKTKLIEELDKEAYTLDEKERKDIHNGYKIIKELTLLGYFTSEAGATQALNYNMVPGRFDGCVDLKPGQKAWA